jgi:hypothetical protein
VPPEDRDFLLGCVVFPKWLLQQLPPLCLS